MAKLIVRFMTVVLELATVLFLIGGGVVGFGYAIKDNDLEPLLALITIPLGVTGGFVVATILLGIPLLILRINQNLEEINQSLKEMNPALTDSKQTSTQETTPFN